MIKAEEIKCNCPMCTKTTMKEGKTYKCFKKDGGGIMGVCSISDIENGFGFSIQQMKNVLNDNYENIKNN